LLGGRAAIKAGCDVARIGQLAQARDAHGVKFIKVSRRNRQITQAFEERHTGVFGLVQHAVIKTQPAELAIHKAGGAGDINVDVLRRGKGR